MAVNSRFIQVHPDAIVEWIFDDQFFNDDNYSIIKDVKNGISSFTFSNDVNDVNNYNRLPNQLYLVDQLINRYGIVDPITKPFLQETKFINNQPSLFNKVKIWFPIHYNFNNSTGFYFNSYGLNYENNVPYNFANFFLDTTIPGDLNKIQNESKPFRLNEKLWGKSITLYVPSLNNEANNRIDNKPALGTINYNLTNGVLGLSQTSLIYLDFRFLTTKSTILGETTYITTPPLITSISQVPEYNNLGVQITEAADGDYFIINGTYNSTIGDFSVFMNTLAESGKRSYILYSITVYEENIPQETRDIYVYKDFHKGIDDYRPVLKFTNTTATIRVDMKLINAIDSSVVTKTSEYSLTGNAVSKYGKYATPINISGAIKPKLYNSKPNQLILPPVDLINSHIKRKNKNKTEIKYISYPILTNSYNIVTQDATIKTLDKIYYGTSDLKIILTPFDNVIKIAISKKINDDTISPFNIPNTNTIVQLVFKSPTSNLRIPLYLESNEVNLTEGVVIFKIPAINQEQIKKIRQNNNTFYITITTNGIETVLYTGLFELSENIKKTTTSIENIATKQTKVISSKQSNVKKSINLLPKLGIKNTDLLTTLSSVQLNPKQIDRLK